MTQNAPRSVAVLIVDDILAVRNLLKLKFELANETVKDYQFSADVAESAVTCIDALRRKAYDVVVLDVRLSDDDRWGGLNLALLANIQTEFGWKAPIRIVVTGYASYEDCVIAGRTGVWDYIVKESQGDTTFGDLVVKSALERLRELDARRDLERRVNEEWLPKHFHELERKYAGKVVALSSDPEIEILAAGADVFALHDVLSERFGSEQAWRQPFCLRFPSLAEEGEGG